MMSKNSAHPKISIYSATQKAPLNLNVNYDTVKKYTFTYQFSYKTEIFKKFYSMHFYVNLLMISIIVLLVSIKFEKMNRKEWF